MSSELGCFHLWQRTFHALQIVLQGDGTIIGQAISGPLGQTLKKLPTVVRQNWPATPARARLCDSIWFKITPAQLGESM
tara:strand:+ start:104 stop:340 length:237 start_codon:yes stop_codon:yes gene_type:complete